MTIAGYKFKKDSIKDCAKSFLREGVYKKSFLKESREILTKILERVGEKGLARFKYDKEADNRFVIEIVLDVINSDHNNQFECVECYVLEGNPEEYVVFSTEEETLINL